MNGPKKEILIKNVYLMNGPMWRKWEPWDGGGGRGVEREQSQSVFPRLNVVEGGGRRQFR